MTGGRAAALAAAVLATLALGACGSNLNDLQAFVAKARAQKVTQIPPIPHMTPYQVFSYAQAGRRDPFVPDQPSTELARTGATDNGIQPDLNRPRQALEQFPLDALRMVGTLTFAGVQYALVSAPDDVVHRVTVGNYMGQDYGRVVNVTPVAIDLIETVPDGFGGWQHKSTKLALASEAR
ncbi:MAG: hypothetical protein EPN72_09330 [Nevskiaceae bacterium]|nr:MAG: hypothetical protein EPN63_08670 [Nevskiaceae bacterium]TBR72636.1 MAG: hypothetical protein EPN72_09330 [Nevskiaceae bacterium]